ncbi:hypothetical protein BKA65DRAFT_581895 [Rhexocercosporidium sp. MPI-PUGE-AT-0058]|nr:hypothetical protein BKA65DRAFT_581895 [Rhexocercosporidium sp. MPI-PUGE-AT-0058]
MANPKATITKAFEDLQRSLSPEHIHKFASTELKEVWTVLQDIQTSQRERRSAQNLRRIEPLLRGLEKYAKVVEVLCNGTPYLSFIWLASNHRDIFDALLDAYADIGSALPRFDRYEETFKSNPEFQFVLAEVYSTILEFHQRTYKFFQRRGKFDMNAWHLIFLSVWKDFRARFDGILHTLEKHRDFVDREANSIDIVEGRAARSRMLEDIAERQRQTAGLLKSNETVNQLVQFHSSLSWLAVDDKKQEAERSRKSGRKHSGTCEWVGQVPEMKAWLQDNNSEPVIWLNGKPGAGKSVMCTVVIDNLDKIESLNVCYYFCDNQDDGRDNPSERVLGVIATQLLRAHPELASLITNEFILPGLSSSLAQLRTLIPKLLELQPYTRIIIDGIDECSKIGQKSLVNELQSTCLGPKLHSKILISSRKEPTINSKLEKKPKICLDENGKVETDIRRYIDHKIQQIQSNFVGELEPKIFTQIASSVADKADGMFLWVRLVTQELEQCFCGRDLEECAKSLPHGLKEAYGRILDRILDEAVSPHIRSLSVRILEWMSCSYRRLKLHEILDGVSIHPNCTSLESSTKLSRRVFDLCRPLVEDGPCDTVVFVHFSAQEYILKAAYKQGKPFIRPEDAHLNIGHSCVAYLNTSFRLLPQNSTEEERIEWIFKGLHGLQPYSNQYWYSHIVDYMDQVVAQKLEVPEYLLSSLKEIVKYSKAELSEDSTQSTGIANTSYSNTRDRFASLGRFPGLHSLVSNVERFRDSLKRQDWTIKEIGVVSLETCASDPSWFSAACHYYQAALEVLLDPDFSKYPTQGLQSFRDMYRDSAFACRYLHCSRATDGFDSLQQRQKHESKHQRVYRCDITTCMDFKKGFATRGQLGKHANTYHARLVGETTLADAVRADKKQRVPVGDADNAGAPPTPATPITPVHPKSFQNRAVQPVTIGQPPVPTANTNVISQQSGSLQGDSLNFDASSFGFPGSIDFADPNNGNVDVLNDFDFDSFLYVDENGVDNFNFDSSAFLDGNKIGAE